MNEYLIPGMGIYPDENQSYYGAYRTRTFADIFPSEKDFSDEVKSSKLHQEFVDSELSIIYYLLYARYGNSHIAFSDENQFKYSVYSTIMMYGPAWKKRYEIQINVMKLTEDEILTGGKAIYNHSYNPSTVPSTDTLDELPTVNEQNTTKYKKSKLEGYGILDSLIKTDVTEEFIGKFKKLFIKVLAPDYPLLYQNRITVNVVEHEGVKND